MSLFVGVIGLVLPGLSPYGSVWTPGDHEWHEWTNHTRLAPKIGLRFSYSWATRRVMGAWYVKILKTVVVATVLQTTFQIDSNAEALRKHWRCHKHC
jgi:hypothetical protein